jgi:hypothetical protein
LMVWFAALSLALLFLGCDFISLKNDSCLASSEELAWRTRRLRTSCFRRSEFSTLDRIRYEARYA